MRSEYESNYDRWYEATKRWYKERSPGERLFLIRQYGGDGISIESAGRALLGWDGGGVPQLLEELRRDSLYDGDE
jgi:hypothetical protein